MSNSKNPIVSIVVPMYNQEHYLDTCIRSICNQTYRDIEVVIVNDGSTDKSPLIARKWEACDSRVKVVDKQNEGPSLARRDGYRVSTGDFLAFVDSDDYMPLDAIDTLVRYMQEKDVDMVIGAMIKKLGFIKKNLDSLFSFPFYQVVKQPELFDDYYLGFCCNSVFSVSDCGRLYRKCVIDKAIQETELFSTEVRAMGEDHYFNMKLFPYLRSMYRIKEPVYVYRYGGGTADFIPNFPHLLLYCDKRLELLDNYKYTAGYGPLFDEYISCFYYQAEQLLEFKKADKAGVIDYFKDELSRRKLIPRLVAHYQADNTENKGASLIVNRDYEGMYAFAYASMKKRCNSLSYSSKKYLNRLIHFILNLT